MRRLLLAASTALLALATVAGSAMAAPGAKPGGMTIVGNVLANDGEFDVLQAAVVKAGLVDALNGTDSYTVFAPSDWAFVSTFRGLLANDSLTEADVISFIDAGGVDTAFGDGALANILLFHVTNGRRNSNSVIHAPAYVMLNGEKLSRSKLLSAGIAKTDLAASNGIIHVIDSVLLP